MVECLVKLKCYEEALDIVRDTESLWPDSLDFTGDFYFYKNDMMMREKRMKVFYQIICYMKKRFTILIAYHFYQMSV
ncbi:hypothetical protein DJ43_922 [Bacillus anthracis]|nr:hypothetical protein DJ43_922 [Bacillus anthracis]